MKIIFIHGMNQQIYNAETLKQYWLHVFQTGLKHADIDIDVDDLDISLPFYGDLLSKHKLNNTLDLGTFLPKSIMNFKFPFHFGNNNASIVTEKDPCVASLPTFNPDQSESFTQRLTMVSSIAKDRALKELVIFLNHYPKLHESLIQKFLIETYLYLSNPEFMHEVHHRVMRHLNPKEEHIIVAHSLGTVIAYNLLHKVRGFRIKRFITLGSPLAFKVIQDKLPIPISRPKHLSGDWMNFYSPDDFLTAFSLSEAPFDFKPPILNQPIKTLINNPHKITGYLENRAVIESIVEALQLQNA